jgi:hypothetical protein
MIDRKILGVLGTCLVFISATAQSQMKSTAEGLFGSRPNAFDSFPSRSFCKTESLESLFHSSNHAFLPLSSGQHLEGEIVARVSQNPYVSSLNIRLDPSAEWVCTFSRIVLEDGSIRYAGRVVSLKSADALMLSEEAGKYYLIKKDHRLVLAE